MNTGTSRYLVVGPTWVGDMVMAQSLFMRIKADEPDAHIDVLAPDWTRPLTERMPEVDSAIGSPFAHGSLAFLQRRQLGMSLRTNGYTNAIVLPGSLKSALIPWFARIPTRTGYVGEQRYGLLNDIRKLDRQALPMTVQRFVALAQPGEARTAKPPPEPRLVPQADAFARTVRELELEQSHAPVLALAPGAEFGASKRWPEEHFIEVARQYLGAGARVWLFGSANDQAVTEKINRALDGQAVDLAGKTRLEQAIDLLSGCAAAVTNDSGLMHVAAALNIPVVAVFGSTSPDSTPPLSPRARAVSIDLECRPCFKRECPLGHGNCLKHLTPDHVTGALDELGVSEASSRP